MFKIFEPGKIFLITSKAPKYVLGLFFIIVSIGLIEALVLSPEDYIQSHSVRIMYVHVPSAWISLGIFSAIATMQSMVSMSVKMAMSMAMSTAVANSMVVIATTITITIVARRLGNV